MYSKLFVSLLAMSLQLGKDAEAVGWHDEVLTPIATMLLPILRSLLPWACSANLTKREPLQRRDLRLCQALPSTARTLWHTLRHR
jgi:hypothetical protein